MKPTRIASVAAIVLLLPVAGAVVAAAAFGGPLLAAAIERAGPATVGREVRVGDVAIDWGRFTTVTADDLVVADAAWSADSPLLRVRRTELTIDLLDAFRLRFSPVRLVLRHPNLDLARNAQGRWNLPDAGTGGGGWKGDGTDAGTGEGRAPRLPNIGLPPADAPEETGEQRRARSRLAGGGAVASGEKCRQTIGGYRVIGKKRTSVTAG